MDYKTLNIILFASTIILGIASRMIKTNNIIWDKYLGDALYAIMFYFLLNIFFGDLNIFIKGFAVFAFMFAIELFQLTNIPLQMIESSNFLFKIIGILLGPKFSWLDILSYAVGIFIICLADYFIFLKNF